MPSSGKHSLDAWHDWSVCFAEELGQPLRVGVQMENGGAEFAEQVIALAQGSLTCFQLTDELHDRLALLAQLAE
jgi:hypothetical protein